MEGVPWDLFDMQGLGSGLRAGSILRRNWIDLWPHLLFAASCKVLRAPIIPMKSAHTHGVCDEPLKNDLTIARNLAFWLPFQVWMI